jgi:uncharacterized membrane protein
MDPVQERWSEQEVEKTLGGLLRAGVLLSAAVVTAGAIIYLFRHGTQSPDYREFQPLPERFRSPLGIVRAAWGGSGRGLIQLGLLFLIATPVARVIFSIYAFIRERDRTYVVVTLIVLVVLLYSLFGPHG